MTIESLRIFAVAGSLLLIAGATRARAAILYTQPTDLNGAYNSQNDTNTFGNYATVYDNFTLSTAANVTNVQWTGSYIAPPSSGVTGFTLTFWNGSAGQPGSAAAPATVIVGNANETSIGNDNLGNAAFTYSANLLSPFHALAATQYWLSIVPDLATPSQWGWESANGGDQIAYQDYFGSRSLLSVDLAFNLNGNNIASTPEPGSLTLLGLGLASVGALGWRKRRKTKVAAV